MKKILFVLVMFISSFMMTGCNSIEKTFHNMSQDRCPSYLWNEYEKYIYSVNYRLWNDSYITSPETLIPQARTVAYTLDKDRPLSVTFFYEEENGRTYELPEITWTQQRLNDYEYREETRYELMESLMDLSESRECVVGPGKVVATILKWEVRNIHGDIKSKYALCDLDGDGSWDYLTGDEMDSYPHPNLSAHFFGYTSEDGYPHCRVNDYNDVYFISDNPIIDLNEYDTAGKTMKYFEKLL